MSVQLPTAFDTLDNASIQIRTGTTLVSNSFNVKVVVRAEILPRDFLQTPGNYYL